MDFGNKIYEDEDLVYYADIAIQKDKTKSIEYGQEYFEKYVSYEGTPVAIQLNQSRVALTEKYCKLAILDIGIGSGEFIKCSKIKVYGYDINPLGVDWLISRGLYVNPFKVVPHVDGWTFWDSLEHFKDPQEILNVIPAGYVFISMPIFDSVINIKKSKHYRQNEHFTYFTYDGLIKYMNRSKFAFIESNDSEIKAGREAIFTFVFLRA